MYIFSLPSTLPFEYSKPDAGIGKINERTTPFEEVTGKKRSQEKKRHERKERKTHSNLSAAAAAVVVG